MSIYSGFATRQQQQTYDHCLNSLLYVLQKRILKFYTNQQTDEYKFASLVQKMFHQLRHLQKAKYLQPKCSYAFQQLTSYLAMNNGSDKNATIQDNSVMGNDSVLENGTTDKHSISHNSKRGQHHNHHHEGPLRQKHYQVPIKIDNQKDNNNSKLLSRSHSKSNSKNIGRIVTASNSRTKIPYNNNSNTLEYGLNTIKQRLPSASINGNHRMTNLNLNNTNNNNYASNNNNNKQPKKSLKNINKITQLRESRNKNMSFNEGIRHNQHHNDNGGSIPTFVKSTTRNNSARGQRNENHQVVDVIRGYMLKAQREEALLNANNNNLGDRGVCSSAKKRRIHYSGNNNDGHF